MKSGEIADVSRRNSCRKKYGSDYYITQHEIATASSKLAHSPELETKHWRTIHSRWESNSLRKSHGLLLISSKQENEFFESLENHIGRTLERQKYINNWFIDGWDNITNTYIQFDGVYWHSQEHRKSRDIEQDKWFKESNITLVRVTDKEWKRDSKGILKSLGELLNQSSSS